MAKTKKTRAATAKKPAASQSKLDFSGLKTWNIWLAVVLALEFIAILILATGKTYPVIATFLGINTVATQSAGQTVVASGLQHLFNVSLVWILAVPLLVGAVAHWLMATYWRKFYEQDLESGVNKVRWTDYTISLAFMLLALGLVLNVHSISTLIMLFAGGLVIGLSGLLAELWQRDLPKVSDGLTHIGEIIVGLAVWVVLAVQLFVWHNYGSGAGAGETWLFFTMLGLSLLFAANQYLVCKRVSKWAGRGFSDKSYMVLAFVAKSALAWQVYAYLLHP